MSDEAQERESTLEDRIAYLSEMLQKARVAQGRYSRIRRMARNQQLMIAAKNGFTLVEDLDEYLTQLANGPLTRQDILREAQDQLEAAFPQGYIQNYTGPKVTP